MRGIEANRRVGAAILAACALAAGCSRGKERAGAGQDSAVMAGVESLAVQNPAFGMNDAEIVGTLDAANAADSSGGAMAVRKARNAEVKSFGQMMMGEHHALRQQGQEVARKASITPDTSAAAKMMAQHDTAARRLDGLSGAQFDRAYIDHEVQVHEQVLSTVQKARTAATNAELKSLLEQAEPVIKRHLDRAKEIQGRLSRA